MFQQVCSVTANTGEERKLLVSGFCLALISINQLNLLQSIITGDEPWVCGHDPKTKHCSSKWKSPSLLQPNKGTTPRVQQNQ
jgi:hypothetical protein